jgi:ribosomal protein S18 acetylase RimI-like enzyme
MIYGISKEGFKRIAQDLDTELTEDAETGADQDPDNFVCTHIPIYGRLVQFDVLMLYKYANTDRWIGIDNTTSVNWNEVLPEGFSPENIIGELKIIKLGDPSIFQITGIKVDEEYRRQGLATKMIEYSDELVGERVTLEAIREPDGKALGEALDR